MGATLSIFEAEPERWTLLDPSDDEADYEFPEDVDLYNEVTMDDCEVETSKSSRLTKVVVGFQLGAVLLNAIFVYLMTIDTVLGLAWSGTNGFFLNEPLAPRKYPIAIRSEGIVAMKSTGSAKPKYNFKYYAQMAKNAHLEMKKTVNAMTALTESDFFSKHGICGKGDLCCGDRAVESKLCDLEDTKFMDSYLKGSSFLKREFSAMPIGQILKFKKSSGGVMDYLSAQNSVQKRLRVKSYSALSSPLKLIGYNPWVQKREIKVNHSASRFNFGTTVLNRPSMMRLQWQLAMNRTMAINRWARSTAGVKSKAQQLSQKFLAQGLKAKKAAAQLAAEAAAKRAGKKQSTKTCLKRVMGLQVPYLQKLNAENKAIKARRSAIRAGSKLFQFQANSSKAVAMTNAKLYGTGLKRNMCSAYDANLWRQNGDKRFKNDVKSCIDACSKSYNKQCISQCIGFHEAYSPKCSVCFGELFLLHTCRFTPALAYVNRS